MSSLERSEVEPRPATSPPQTALEPVPPWALNVARWLDDFVRIPGTRIGIGLDALIGFVFPGLGDALTGIGSAALLWLALRSGVPRVVLLRMIMNIGIDVLVGAVPVVGDLFDVGWKANRKNLELIERHRREEGKSSALADYLIVGLGIALLLLAVLLPLLLAAWFVRALGRHAG